MGRYTDVYVLPVTSSKLDAYREVAADMGRIWREHGALDYTEVVAADAKPGVHTSFPQAVKLEPDETIVVAWIDFASREERDRINVLVMQDQRMTAMFDRPIPVDGKRMFFGGFDALIQI